MVKTSGGLGGGLAGGANAASSWTERSWVGFDTETTGVSPLRDRVVTAAVAIREGGARPTRGDHGRQWLANPGVPIPTGAAKIHGVTTRDAERHGRPPAQVLEEVNAALAATVLRGGCLVVFNAGFDLPLLEAESTRHQVQPLSHRLGGTVAPVVDPLVLDRALVERRRGKRTLTDLVAAYGVTLPKDTHRADVDATLTLDLLAAMVDAYPSLNSMSAMELHRFQARAHAKWAESFERFLRSVGRSDHISRTWF